MVEAYRANIIYPNKHDNSFGKFHEGHLVQKETYKGGFVEALACGVYRDDLDVKFSLDSSAFQEVNLSFPLSLPHEMFSAGGKLG